ncbi:hypothetical protein ABDK56_04295 [Sphingomonas sp. ASV193]|uniref:hypothetical protein n=1 Tax=Sphingomonas sp. ASV193 TaxID=3144405 RepID=UPI0032E89491
MSRARLALAVAALFALGGCDALDKLAKKREAKAGPAANAAAPVADESCAEGWRVSLDEASFASASLSADRLDALGEAVGERAADSADQACADGALDPARARAVRHVVVANSADGGAPLFRLDGDTVRVEWGFARHELALPGDGEWRAGLICSIDPESEECPHESAAQ